MRIAKSWVLRFVAEHAGEESAARAREFLDDPVDTDAQGGLLAQLGVSVLELTAAAREEDTAAG